MERVTEIGPGIHQLVSYRDNFAGLPGSNAFYVVGRDGAVFIDTGYDHEGDHAIRTALWRETGSPTIVQIIAMHRHADHAGGAALLHRETGAPIACHPADRKAIEDEHLQERADVGRELVGGESIDLGGMTLQVSHAPGHTPGSLAVLIPERGALFTTDTVLANSTTAIGEQGDMADYLRTIKGFQQISPKVIYPGHGGPIEDTASWLDFLVKHREKREAQLLEEIAGGRNTVPVLGAFLYPKLDTPKKAAMGQGQVRSMLRKLIAEGRVREAPDGTLAVAR